jgi:hypothetical protein
MKTRFADLWRSTGTMDRGAYAFVGVMGFALKHNLDRFVATVVFRRPWGLFNYWVPLRDVAKVTALGSADARFLAAMVALALPFIWIGVTLTIKRLRSAGLPLSLGLLFFIPFLNLLFFLWLSLVPAQALATPREVTSSSQSSLARIIPESAVGSAAISLLITVPLGVCMVFVGTQLLANYGWGLFVALPFTMGFAAALIYGVRRPRSLSACIGVASLSVGFLGLALLASAIEGMVCLMMALPIAWPLAALGGSFGYLVQQRTWLRPGAATTILPVLLLVVPGIEWLEHVAAPVPEVYAVRTAIDIQAPPDKVWNQVVAFTEIPPPTEWIFRAGVAYPMRAEIRGSGPGAERHCVFSTGAFIEPIEIWDEPRLLKFSVEANPAPMEEWTPYSHIDPPHLHGFLVSNGGQFLLTPLPNGGTHLEGTTWYRHTLWPAAYWRLWSDAIIHRIHLRVLRHIRDEAEKPDAPRGDK